MAYPIAVAVISLVFAATVLQQYLSKRKPHQLVWSVALAMSAAAAAAYVFALPPVHSQAGFRAYYWLGALCMPAWLGLGSIYLVAPRKAADRALGFLINASLLGAAAIWAAPVDLPAFSALDGGPGTSVLQPGPWLPLLILLNTLGVAAVVVVAIYSGIRAARRRMPGRLLLANACIAAGDLVIGVAGSMARVGFPGLFWITMSVGWVIIFAGFLLTLPFPATSVSAPRLPESPSLQ